MDQETFNKMVLQLSIVLTAAGGMLLVAFAMDGMRRYATNALIGFVAGVLLAPLATPAPVVVGVLAEPRHSLFPVLGHDLDFMVIGAIAGLALALFGRADGEKSDGLRRLLRPSRWKDGASGPGIAPRDMARRWFVTVAAATGSVVISLIAFPEFWSALSKTLDPIRLVGAVALTFVSMVLIGPFQDFVLRQGDTDGGDQSGTDTTIARIFENGMTWRAWLRFALVWLLLVATDLLLNNLGEAVRSNNPQVMAAIITTGLAPAVVSYYWSAALQHGIARVGRATVWPSTACGAVIFAGSGFLIAMSIYMAYFYPPSAGHERDVIVILPVGLVLAAAIGFATCGIHAAVGGHVLDRFHGIRALLLLAAAMIAVGVLQVVVMTGAIWLAGSNVNPWSYGNYVGGIAGWYLGLLASGFPQLVMRRQPASAVVAA